VPAPSDTTTYLCHCAHWFLKSRLLEHSITVFTIAMIACVSHKIIKAVCRWPYIGLQIASQH
jgi:hypothetical protein